MDGESNDSMVAWIPSILIFIIMIYARHLNKLCHFIIVVFISSSKRYGLFPIFKMADDNAQGDQQGNSNLVGMGRARVLIEAVVEFCRRGRGQRPPSPSPGGCGRAGPQALLRQLVQNQPAITHNPGGRSLRSLSPPHPGRGRASALPIPAPAPFLLLVLGDPGVGFHIYVMSPSALYVIPIPFHIAYALKVGSLAPQL